MNPLDQEDSNRLEIGSENYFISITDLMTSVIFIFVILLIAYSQSFRTEQLRAAKLTQQRELLAKRAEEAKRHADEQSDTVAAVLKTLEGEKTSNRQKAMQIDGLAKLLRDREESRRRMLEELASRLRKMNINVVLDADNGIIRLPESLLFDVGKADLREEGETALITVGRELISVIHRWCPPGGDFQLESFFIEGHTDSIPISNEKFKNNWELSTARAVATSMAVTKSATELLTLMNLSKTPILGVSGYGENRPVASNGSEEGRRLNRRIDLRFIVAYPTAEQFMRVKQLLEK